MKNILYIIGLMTILTGCTTINDPKIESTKPWEQHYKSVDEFKTGTKDIVLDDDETIWVMSNKTLKRLLINVK